jgi:hypothetical protein
MRCRCHGGSLQVDEDVVPLPVLVDTFSRVDHYATGQMANFFRKRSVMLGSEFKQT